MGNEAKGQIMKELDPQGQQKIVAKRPRAQNMKEDAAQGPKG